MGKVRMVATEFENAGRLVKNRNAVARCAEPGRFVLWQMAPGEVVHRAGLSVGARCMLAAMVFVWQPYPRGSAPHAAKGPVRPFAVAPFRYNCTAQPTPGLDPLTAASMFAGCTVHWGEEGERGGLLHPEAVH
ncbi:hypothetical protein ZWY2020_053293 [Hordeum vulgare]|nr:hypothetical protein ZWY2020_053293 [Hordeum vulgare]